MRGVTSYNNNIKCVDSIIKYIDFESFYYIINLDVVLAILILCLYGYIVS